MNDINNRVRELIARYDTAQPEELCEKMGVTLISQELPESVNGFTVTMYGIPFIVLNSELNYYAKRLTTAHELGHIVLHKGTNTLELSLNTGFCVSKYEREADCFAALLLMQAELSEFDGMETVTAETVARITHVPKEIVERAFL